MLGLDSEILCQLSRPPAAHRTGHSAATMAPGVINDQASLVLVNGFPCIVGIQLVYFAFVRFGLERFIMPKAFRKAYTELTIINQRSFTAHVLWLTVKLCLIPAAWPFIQVFFVRKSLEDPLFNGTSVSNADFLSVAYFAVIAMFLFEIIYRLKISPVSLIHHTAGCALAAWQTAEQVMHDDAGTDSQFRLLILYGVFEVVFETFPHFAVIYYRCQAKTAEGYRKTSRIWLYSGISSLVGTSLEFIAMGFFMWRNWQYWGIDMRVVIPILHFAFMAAQVHGARVGFQLHSEFKKKSRKSKDEEQEVVESSPPKTPPAEETKILEPAIRVERESVADEPPSPTESIPPCYCREPQGEIQLPTYPGV